MCIFQEILLEVSNNFYIKKNVKKILRKKNSFCKVPFAIIKYSTQKQLLYLYLKNVYRYIRVNRGGSNLLVE